MSASESAPRSPRRPSGLAAWLSRRLTRAQQQIADVVLPCRLSHGVISPREIEGL